MSKPYRSHITEEQFARLPLYAIREIERLRSLVGDLESQLGHYRGQIDHPYAFLPQGLGDPLPIAGGETMRRVLLGDGDEGWSVELTEKGGLEVRARWGVGVSVRPVASNIIRVDGV